MKVAAALLLTVWYPLLTIYTIVVTGNHFWSDALGGLAYVFVGFFISKRYFVNKGRMLNMERVAYGDVYENSKNPNDASKDDDSTISESEDDSVV